MANSRLRFLAALLPLAPLLAGCASAPATNYYMLSPVEADAASAQLATVAPAVVAVGPVALPDYLDRPQMIVREDAYRLRLAAGDQWAAPLADMLPRVLVQNLAARLPSDRVVAFPQVTGPNFDYRVAVSVERFDVDASGTATLLAHWQVYERIGNRALVVSEDTLQRKASDPGYAASAAALSGTLADLSDRIAERLRTLRAGAPSPLAGR